MDITSLLLLFGVGCIVGLLTGFFGIGGGVMMVPALIFFYHNSGVDENVLTQMAFGTSLFIMTFASFSSAYRHNKNQNVIWKGVIIIGLSSIISAYFGTSLAVNLKGPVLQKIFAVILILTAIRMLFEFGKEKDSKINLNFLGLVFLGIVVGILSALTGLGGGVISIPIMYYLFKFPIKKAVGSSSAIIVLTAVAGSIGYMVNGLNTKSLPSHTIGFIDYQSSIAIIIGSLPFSQIGAHLSNKVRSHFLRQSFSVLLILVSIKIIMGI